MPDHKKTVTFGIWEQGITIRRPLPDGREMVWRMGEREADLLILNTQKALAVYRAKKE